MQITSTALPVIPLCFLISLLTFSNKEQRLQADRLQRSTAPLGFTKQLFCAVL